MANKHATGTHSTVIRCPNCGEDYSITYKRCPFCDEKTVPPSRRRGGVDEYDEDLARGRVRRRGRPSGRQASGRVLPPAAAADAGAAGGGGEWTPLRVVGTVISVALIVAAVWIVITVVMPLVGKGKVPAEPTPPATSQVTPTPPPSIPAEHRPPARGDRLRHRPRRVRLTPGTEPSAPPSQQIPATQTATGFTLNKSDITINNAYPDPGAPGGHLHARRDHRGDHLDQQQQRGRLRGRLGPGEPRDQDRLGHHHRHHGGGLQAGVRGAQQRHQRRRFRLQQRRQPRPAPPPPAP